MLIGLVAAGFAQEATDYSADIERFRPAQDTFGYGSTESAATLGHLQVGVGLWGNYSEDSVVLVWEGARLPAIEEDGDGVIDNRSVADLQVGLGISKYFSFTVDAPVALWQSGFEPAAADDPARDTDLVASGLMDVRVAPKFVLVDIADYPVGVAVIPRVTLPTGAPVSFLGEAGFAAEPTLAVELADGPVASREYKVRFAVNATYRARSLARFRDVLIDDEFVYRAAFAVHPTPPVELGAEIGGAVGGPLPAHRPVELSPYLKLIPIDLVTITAGAGLGLSPGLGSPDFRVWGGATLAPSFDPRDQDADKDGIPNNADACKFEPEDFDGFEDEDGCPELDNDQDGIVDTEDACPLVPEDLDGFEDSDGCPEDDNDQDGFKDLEDDCPDDAETRNGYKDGDGCPDDDPDTDGDGYVDSKDQCPRAPEDFDEFEDEDGCPEHDNDGDGIPDVADGCPLVPENRNGVEDDDGCPDDDAPKRVIIEKSRIKITETIYFDFNKASIKKESYGLLDEIALVILEHPNIRRIRVEGHTDSDGDDAYNLRLSQARAESVVNYLVAAGLERSRFVAEGFGESRPLMENDTDAHKASNRRVEFIIVEQD